MTAMVQIHHVLYDSVDGMIQGTPISGQFRWGDVSDRLEWIVQDMVERNLTIIMGCGESTIYISCCNNEISSILMWGKDEMRQLPLNTTLLDLGVTSGEVVLKYILIYASTDHP